MYEPAPRNSCMLLMRNKGLHVAKGWNNAVSDSLYSRTYVVMAWGLHYHTFCLF